ncbi:MAG: ferrochelatase [Planctomycetes bacterium]|nr:ferrochelatase [Planctomycetota bacterium]
MDRDPRPGVLLINLGTPDSTSTADVRRYLAEFLNDPLVLDIPSPLRRLLVHGIILRTRPRRSAEAYRSIWTERGSPLLAHGQDLAAGLARELGDAVAGVELAMRYRLPRPGAALERLRALGTDEIVVVPLFPQYSMAAWASAVVAVQRAAERARNVPALRVVPPFYDHPAFLAAAADVARESLADFAPDRVLLSFHGVPERHCTRSDDGGGSHCLRREDCCDAIVAANRQCYRAQCFATARGLAAELGLDSGGYEVAFQSRFTKAWIRPFTDERLRALPGEGVRRLAVLCPAFVADCLETIEEIGMRGAADFRAAGGEELRLVPCVNAHPAWVRGLAHIIRENLRAPVAAGSPR